MEVAFMVRGSTGSYDDRRSWPVAIYLDKALADAHQHTANVGAAAILAEPSSKAEFYITQATDFDPFFIAIDGAVHYGVVEVPFMGLERTPDMRNWFAVSMPAPAPAPVEAELSEAEKVVARAAFLSTLPRVRRSKKAS